ncbi:hypothetical protein B0H10DRAFT_1971150 [Mycena sp. CBHHK59/15]|nr:hypothetical protein B0H10DRAFT_1971150 [Mycena sp. CBHHK59/15]
MNFYYVLCYILCLLLRKLADSLTVASAFFTTGSRVSMLEFNLAIIQGQAAQLRAEVASLRQVKDGLEACLVSLVEEFVEQQELSSLLSYVVLAQRYRFTEGNDALHIIEAGLKELDTSNARAENQKAQLKEAKVVIDVLRKELAAKDAVLASQSRRISDLVDISEGLARRLSNDAAEHEAALDSARKAQDARDIINTEIIASEKAKVSALEAKVKKLKAHTKKILTDKAAEQARNIAQADTIASQAATVSALQTKVKTLEATEQARDIDQASQIASHEATRAARSERARLQDAARARATIVEPATRHGMERASAKKERTDVGGLQVDKTMADGAAPSLSFQGTAVSSPTSSNDASFSLESECYFSPCFVVSSRSAFAQARIAGPSSFVSGGRRIVKRGGDSAVTPLLLPAWTVREEGRREVERRSTKRVRRV